MELDKKGTWYLVGDFSEEDLKKQIDKKVVAQKSKETGLSYTYTKEITRNGKRFLRIWLVDLATWSKIPLL